jgi:hypothetical protein
MNMEKMTKAEQMHAALKRFAKLEMYMHQNKGVYDDITQFLQNAPEESKERLYDLMAVHTALAEVPQSDIADRLCVDIDPEQPNLLSAACICSAFVIFSMFILLLRF